MKIVKDNPIKLISVGLLIGILGLNCFGFCFEQMRFMSDQERIEVLVRKEALRSYMWLEGTQIRWPLAKYGSAEYIKQTTVGTPEYFDRTNTSLFGKPLPYKDINEFFRQNPNCCKVVRSLDTDNGLFQVSVFGCITGLAPYLVSVEFLVNYTDKDGLVKSAPVSGFYKMSSCGTIKDFLD